MSIGNNLNIRSKICKDFTAYGNELFSVLLLERFVLNKIPETQNKLVHKSNAENLMLIPEFAIINVHAWFNQGLKAFRSAVQPHALGGGHIQYA